MSVGERIRKFRVKRGLLQKQLAQKCRMSESAIRNYELDNRTPNEKALEVISGSLGVSPYAMADPSLDNEHAAMHTLFRFEELYGFKIDKIDGQVCLIPTSSNAISKSIKSRLSDWYKVSEQLSSGDITEEDYQEWKDSYPESNWSNTKKMLDLMRKQLEEENKK